MELTRVKRNELKRGDMFCLGYEKQIASPIYVARTDGNDSLRIADDMMCRIDAPDYAHELTQFSWKLKELDDKVGTIEIKEEQVPKRDQSDAFDPDIIDGYHAADLEQLDLLDDILKIVNTTIHHKMKSPYRKNDAFDAERMREVCDEVTDFRYRHNIVG